MQVNLSLESAVKYFEDQPENISDENKAIAGIFLQLISSFGRELQGSDYAQIASLIKNHVHEDKMRDLTTMMVALMNSGIKFERQEIKETIPVQQVKSWASVVASTSGPPKHVDTPRPTKNIKQMGPCERFGIDSGYYQSGLDCGKYKIEPCRYQFDGKGKCRQGGKCNFAHSTEELKWFKEKNKELEEEENADYELSDDDEEM